MAASSSSGIITVTIEKMVNNILDDEIKTYFHHWNKTVAEIKEIWATEVKVSAVEFYLEHNGQEVPESKQLSELIQNQPPVARLIAKRHQGSQEQLKVAVTDNAKGQIYFLPPTATVADVKAKWSSDYKILEEEVQLLRDSASSQPLPDNFRISTLLPDASTSNVINLTARKIEIIKKDLLVIVSDPSKTEVKTFRHSPEDTVADVKRQWAALENIAMEDIVMQLNGNVIDETSSLAKFQESNAGVIQFTAECAMVLHFQIAASTTLIRYSIKAFPSQMPFQLHATIQQLFSIIPEREFRLQTDDCPLDYEKTLEQNGVKSECQLEIDLAFNVTVSDAWDGSVRQHELYASDSGSDMLIQGLRTQQRLQFRGSTLRMADSVMSTLHPIDGDCFDNFQLTLVYQRTVYILSKHIISHRDIWPNSKIRKTIWRVDPRLELMFHDQLISNSDRFVELDTPDNALFHTSPLNVTLFVRKKKYKKVRVPQDGCVNDLMLAAGSVYRDGDFRLFYNGQFLDQIDAALPSAGVKDCISVEIMPSDMLVTIEFEDHSWERSFKTRKIKFTRLVETFCEDQEMRFKQWVKKPLFCMGCQRKLTKEEESIQRIPSRCCQVRSLRLSHRVQKDVGTQHSYRKKAKSTMIQTRDEISEVEHERTPHVPHEHEHDHNDHDCESDFSLTLQLPDETTRFPGSPDSTLEDVVNFLRFTGKSMAVMDIKVDTPNQSRRSLIDSIDWREKTLVKCEIQRHSTLYIEPVFHKVIRVDLHFPTLENPETHYISLEPGEGIWKTIEKKLERKTTHQLEDMCIVYQKGIYYIKNGKRSQAIRSWSDREREAVYVDEFDGCEVSYNNRTDLLWHSIFEESPIRASATHMPIVKVFLKALVHVFEYEATSQFAIQNMPSKMQDEDYLLFMCGLEMTVGGFQVLFIECYDKTFFSCTTGQNFENESKVFEFVKKEYPGETHNWSRVIQLLKHNDLIPKYPKPQKKCPLLHIRDGIDITIEGNRIVKKQSQQFPRPSVGPLWSTPREITHLEKKITELMKIS